MTRNAGRNSWRSWKRATKRRPTICGWSSGGRSVSDFLALDFETYYSQTYSVADLGYFAYCHHPKFDAYLVAAVDASGAEACHPSKFNWTRAHGRYLLAHNANFDRAVFEALQEKGVIHQTIRPAGWLCTAALSAFCQCPRSLAGAAKAVLGVEVDKAPRSRAKGNKTAELFDGQADYAATDARICWQLWEKAGRYWPTKERELWALTHEMGRRGLWIDQHHLQLQMRAAHEKVEAALAGIPWAASSPPTSPKQLAAACGLEGIRPPSSTDEDSPAYMSWAAEHGDTTAGGWVRSMQAYRRANRAALVLEAMFARLKPDGRMEAHLAYWGASTGRWSGGGNGLNLQNLNSDSDICDLRGCIAAPPDNALLVLDLAQIEARVLLWLAHDEKTLDLVRQGVSVYEAHARATMGWAGGTLKTENPATYKLAKARVLGLGYGCGAGRFAHVAKIMADLDITEKQAAETVDAYRATNPGITALWGKLGREFQECDGGTYALRLPSGRSLIYRNVNALEGTAEQIKGEKPAKIYGALIVENLVQALARDLFADRLLALAQAGFRPVLLVHDEYVIESPATGKETALADAIRIIEQPPSWAVGLPIGVEGKILGRYAK